MIGFGAIRLIPTLAMVKTVEDWSRVRSPARAARRRRLGYRQNIVFREVPRTDAILCEATNGQPAFIAAHPLVIERIKAAIPETRP